MPAIRPARTANDLKIVKHLFEEYAASLPFDLDFQGFEAEMAGFPGRYAEPAGKILVAGRQGEIIGCVALRALEGTVCEMKRLYVRPGQQRRGAGRKLAETIVSEAASMGYTAMRLDTAPGMTAAITLYRSMGFAEIAPYCHNPIPGALFFELNLQSRQAGQT
jgi:ribosomal protein S18 acetylase RimI-like enzyme